MGNYVLTRAAVADLETLLEYGIDNFGEAIAVSYFDGFKPGMRKSTF